MDIFFIGGCSVHTNYCQLLVPYLTKQLSNILGCINLSDLPGTVFTENFNVLFAVPR